MKKKLKKILAILLVLISFTCIVIVYIPVAKKTVNINISDKE